MQQGNWNDFRYVLAIKRGGTLAKAARLAGVDSTTVSRRVSAVESAYKIVVVERSRHGCVRLTPEGEEIAKRAEAIEHQVGMLNEAIGSGQQACSGVVRISSVPLIVNRVLATGIGPLVRENPELVVELIPESRDVNLTFREADLAVRLARPREGGTSVKARRLGYLKYAAYASVAFSDMDAARLQWVGYEERMLGITPARWISKTASGSTLGQSGLRVHDAETALEAVRAGLGITILPTLVADRVEGIRQVTLPNVKEYPSRELWLLGHADQMELRRVKTAMAWLDGLLSGPI